MDPVEVSRILEYDPLPQLSFKQLFAKVNALLKNDLEDCTKWGFDKLDIMQRGKVSTIVLKMGLKSIMRSYSDARFRQVTIQMMRMIAQNESEMRLFNTRKDFKMLVRQCIMDSVLTLSKESHLGVNLHNRGRANFSFRSSGSDNSSAKSRRK